MVYTQYITKKRCKINGISGNVNIPYGTICDVVDGYILYNHKIVCACRSQNGKDYFWGYDSSNPKEEIKRQETVAELMQLAPPDSTEELLKEENPWRKYGYLAESMFNTYMWMWNDSVEDMNYLDASNLLTHIKQHKSL